MTPLSIRRIIIAGYLIVFGAFLFFAIYIGQQERIAVQPIRLFIILTGLLVFSFFTFFFLIYRRLERRYNAELASRVNEKTIAFKNILDRISDGFIALDRNWDFVYVNSASARIMGRDDLVGKNMWKEYPDGVDNEFYKAYHKAMETQEYVFIEAYYPRFDGWYENHIYPSPGGLTIHSKDISEKKKTEQRLQQAIERFNVVATATNEVVWEADLIRKTLWWNDNFYEKFGYNKTTEIPSDDSWENYLHPDDKERVVQTVNAVIADSTQNTWIDEYRFAKADGTWRNIYDRCLVVRDTDGNACKLIGSMADLTSLFETRKELEKTEERYRDLVNSIDGIVWEANAKTFQFHFVSEQAEKILGYPVSLWRTVPGFWADHIHPDDKDWAVNFCVQSTREKKPHQFEYRMIAADGRVVWLRDIVSVVVEDDQPVLLRGIMVDITASRDAEEAIRQSEEKYRTLIEQATDGIFIADTSGRFIMVNSSGCKMAGCTEEELKQMSIYDFADTEDLQMNPFQFDEMKSEKGARVERKMRKKDGSIIDIEVNAKFLSDGRFLAFIRDITDRKKAMEELRANEENTRLIMDAALDAIICVDTEGKITVWSSQAAKIFGWEREEVIGRKISDTIIPEQYRQSHNRGLLRYNQTGEGPVLNKLIEITALNKEGKEFPIELSIVPVNQGRSTFFCAFLRDISERKKAESAVLESENRLQTILDTAPECIKLMTPDVRLITMNAAGLTMIEADSLEQIKNQSLLGVIATEQREKAAWLIKEAFNGRSAEMEFEMTTLKGNRRWCEIHVVPFRNATGDITAVLGLTRDMTLWKKAEEELKISEQKYRTLVEQAADAIFIFNDKGQFVDVNSVATELLGYTKFELLSMLLPGIIFKDKHTSTTLFGLLDRGESVIRRLDFRRKDESSVTVEMHAKKLPDGRYLGMVRNLTERIEAERQLRESFREIRQLTDHIQNIREEERAHIAREIHDELGQQLTVLKMDVSWLNKRIGISDEAVKEKLRNLAEMLDGTVRTVRRISSELRPSLLDDLGLVAAMDWHLREFGKRFGVKTEFREPENDILLSDTVKTGLFRIFQESLTNVARHADAKKVKVSLEHKKDQFVLSIEDNGKGFDKLKNRGKKTLGILGMKERTAMMGGTYETESVPGSGTVVIVSVPLKP